MKRIATYIIICFFAFTRIHGQDRVIRSLRASLFIQKDSIGYTDVLNQLGMQYHLSNTDSCFWYGVEAREVATRIGYRKGIAGALNNLSIFYMLKGNIRQAIEYGYRSLLLYREIGDDENICQLLMNLSIYHAYDNKIPEANNFLYQALDIGKKLPRDSVYSLVLINYAIRFEYDSTKEDSVKWALEGSKAIITKYPGSREKYYIRAFEADEWMRSGEGAKAVKRINELADSALGEGLIVVAIDLLEHIDAYNRLGYPADAVPAREKAFKLGRRAGYTDLMLPIVISLYRHYVKTGNEQARLYYGNALRELVERRLALKERNHLNHLEYFLTEQELEELQLRNKIQETSLARATLRKKTRTQIIGFLTGMLLLLGGFTIFRYRAYKNLRKQEELLTNINNSIFEKNEQLRVHDDFKNKLIAILARDFRQPLNNIVRVSGLFRNENADRQFMEQVINQAEASSRKTLLVFDNILRWIKSQLSGFVYNPAPCDLHQLYEDALPDTGREGITMKIPEGLMVAGDQEMIRFINRSLLYCAGIRPVHISAMKEEEQVKAVLSYEDSSCTEETAAKLFEYRQGDDMSITLVICKDFMDKMGGHIWAEKEGDTLRLIYALPSFH